MKISIRKGIGFGLTSGIITTLGLIVGLGSGTHSKTVVLSGILVIAIADALSDAFGIHISEEAEGKHRQKEVWESTFSTLISKFIFALIFLIPVLLLNLNLAIIASVLIGLTVISIASYFIAKQEKLKPSKVIFEHILLTIIVVIATYLIGILAEVIF